jgi:hypothetical protein
VAKQQSHTRLNDLAVMAEGRSFGFCSEFWYFMRHNKKWWLTPIIAIMLLLGLLIVLAGSGAAPLIYTLF